MPSIDIPDLNAPRVRCLLPIALACGAYAVLVLLMWGAFNPASGLGYETAFPYMSESGPSWWSGFLYTADPLRIHTNTFYHLSYLFSIVLGIRGSYVAYQMVYALLWWGRGVLVFLLLRRFTGRNALVPYVGGALVLVHSSDGALQWIGQMNQFGFIFWMLLAFYLLTLAASESRRWGARMTLLVLACFFEYMSLWSYESQLPLILVYPAILLLLKPGWRKWSLLTAGWYVTPGVYLLITVRKYLSSSGATYQESVLRTGWSAMSLVQDLWFNIASSLEFWAWRREPVPPGMTTLLSIGTAVAFVAGGMAMVRTIRKNGAYPLPETNRFWWVLLSAGSILLILSFPVYLLLGSARGLWRTQFLSGIGAGLVWTAILGLISITLWKKARQSAAMLAAGAIIVYFGASSAIAKGAVHRATWERHRAYIVQILDLVPSVKPGAVIVLTGVPRKKDPFGHNMWLDMALRLCYPGIPVAGVYYYSDGTPSPGNNLEAAGEGWKMQPIGMPTLVRESSLANTIVVEWNPSGPARLAKVLPEYICHAPCDAALYNPANVITGPISPVAVNRYHP